MRGDFKILNNPEITLVNFILHSERIGGDVQIDNNYKLTSVVLSNGLSYVKHVGGFFSVTKNPKLYILNESFRLTDTGGYKQILYNESLSDIYRLFVDLQTISGYFFLIEFNLDLQVDVCLFSKLVDVTAVAPAVISFQSNDEPNSHVVTSYSDLLSLHSSSSCS